MHPLDTPVLKLLQAQRHLETVRRMEKDYIGSRPFSIERQIRNRGRRHTFIFRLHHTVPPEFGVAIGDTVHNMRSALDHLAWQFALLTKSTARATYFPLETNRKDYERTASPAQRALRTIPHPQARAIIDQFQPFHRHSVLPSGSPLAVLERLSNIDKHRNVNLTFVASRAMGVDAEGWQERLNIGVCVNGRAIADFTTSDAEPPPPPTIEFQPILLFDKAVSPSRVIPAVEILDMCGKTVALALRSANSRGLFPQWPGIRLMDGTCIPPLPPPPPHWA